MTGLLDSFPSIRSGLFREGVAFMELDAVEVHHRIDLSGDLLRCGVAYF